MPDENGQETPEEKTAREATEAAAAASAAVQAPKVGSFQSQEELDEYLSQRDQRLLAAVQQNTVAIVSQLMQQQGGQQRHEPTQAEVEAQAVEAQNKLNISPEEFWRDPQTAMNKFFEAKTAPMRRAQAQAPQQQDMTGITALAETRRIELMSRLSEADKAKYGPYLNAVIQRTDPRILADPSGMDSVWRLTRSYADDDIGEKERKRNDRNQRANLGPQGQPASQEQKVVLGADEAVIAERMGLSPELYRKYSEVEEVTPGSAYGKK